MISIIGYDHLGQDRREGLRYAWGDMRFQNLIESAAFNSRTKLGGESICAYTASVSSGCILKSKGLSCLFCRTGQVLPFGGMLTYKEIAKQNIFMVLADMDCDDNPSLADREREFAYMGQGEPGYSYDQVRLAIELTNKVMKKLGQKVYRHIFATSGIPSAIKAFRRDLKGFFSERVTLHLSVHAFEDRGLLMPVDRIHPLSEVLTESDSVSELTGEKTCIGIMLFSNFHPKNSSFVYSNTIERVEPLLKVLSPEKYRLSFCEYNPAIDVGDADYYSNAESDTLLCLAKRYGFEAKLFSSFGRDELSACGLLGGKSPSRTASEKWKRLDALAEDLINND